MSRANMLLLPVFGLLLFFSCQSQIDITPPVILVSGPTLDFYALDTLKINTVQYAEIGGTQIPPDYFEWTIRQASNNTVIYQSQVTMSKNQTNDSLQWIPEETGVYIIYAKIGYDGNKSVTAVKDIRVYESARSLLRKVSGTWQGDGETVFATFTVDSLRIWPDGHFEANATNWNSNTYNGSGVFYMHSNVNSPTNRLHINRFTEVTGAVSGGVLLQSQTVPPGAYTEGDMCLKWLYLSNGGDSLYLAVGDWGIWGCNSYPWYVQHRLKRLK